MEGKVQGSGSVVASVLQSWELRVRNFRVLGFEFGVHIWSGVSGCPPGPPTCASGFRRARSTTWFISKAVWKLLLAHALRSSQAEFE